MLITIDLWLNFTIFLFCLGTTGAIFNNQNFLHVLFNFEIMLLGVSLTYTGFSIFFNEPKGQIYALMILVVAAAESCVGLALLITFLRLKGTNELLKMGA